MTVKSRLSFLFLNFLVFSNPAEAFEIKGDEKALALMEKMLERLGGKEKWANARSVYVVERAHVPNSEDAIMAYFWRDLDEPIFWSRRESASMNVFSAILPDGTARVLRNGEKIDRPQDSIDLWKSLWPRLMYTLYHQLAKGEWDLTLQSTGNNGFFVINAEGEIYSEFQFSASGETLYWQMPGQNDPEELVLGPYKDFGGVRFHGWGTRKDAGWRFENIEVRLSPDPVPASLFNELD